MIDIVFPEGNEKEFVELCGKLGNKGLVFLYKRKEDFAELSKLKTRLYLCNGIIADFKGIQNARRHSELVVVKSSDKDRLVLEKSKADVLFGLEESAVKDFMHQRASGLNQILCRLAAKNNMLIGFSFSSLLSSSGSRKAQIFGRMMQNIALCRKYNVKTAIASFAKSPYEMRASRDLEALFALAGMHPKECKESLEALEKRIKGVNL